MQHHERFNQAKKATLIGAVINLLLGFIKLISGFFFHSHALIADGVHSFSDIITDIMVLFASKYGSQDADESHPYGHKRIETATTLILALLLILAGTGIAWDSLVEIIHKHHTTPAFLALPVALISILANEGLFHYTLYVGKRIRSDLVIANAWHHRSDAASSLVVLVGLLGSLAGWIGFDALAAIVVGCLIIQMGLSYGWNSVKELIDTGVDAELIKEITSIIIRVNGVIKIHQLRTRMMGGDIYIDVHILVSPIISVSEGHFIAQQVHQALIKRLERIKDVTVHVDPEDDEINSPSFHLPDRKTLERDFLHPWRTEFPCIQLWVLHYLNGKLSIDLICDEKNYHESKLKQKIDSDLVKLVNIDTVRLLSHKATLVILRANA